MTKKIYPTGTLGLLYLLIAFQSVCFALPPIKGTGDFIIKRGTNISHWLSQSEARGDARKNYFTEKDVKYLASLGFDHIRIPVDEMQLWLENGQQDQEGFSLLHQALNWCKKYNLKAVVDLHILRSHHLMRMKNLCGLSLKHRKGFFNAGAICHRH